jgi:hypothetical protein
VSVTLTCAMLMSRTAVLVGKCICSTDNQSLSRTSYRALVLLCGWPKAAVPATNNSTRCNRRATYNRRKVNLGCIAADASAAPVELAPTFKIAKGEAVGCTLPAPWGCIAHVARCMNTVRMLQPCTCCNPSPQVAARRACCNTIRPCNTLRPAATQYMCSAVRTDGMLQVHDMAWFPHMRSDGAPPSHLSHCGKAAQVWVRGEYPLRSRYSPSTQTAAALPYR